jgi:hypothetical protein
MALLSDKQMDHPKFMHFSDVANAALVSAFKSAGLDPDVLQTMDVHAGRVVDALTALMLRADKQAKR